MLSFITETQSCWDRLKAEERPIFIYGMGDGALKIMNVFKQRGIAVSGIFASDDFVRGHSFEGFRVHKLSEIEEAVDDFVVVLAFAAGYQEIVDKIHEIAEKHTLYVPDVPVVGTGLFTYEYCKEHEEQIQKVYDSLADDYS
ncbi:MAG TPA: FkbM family methyltransferase, partial [Ruminococcus flavefaciens]|nr:FkbM family methyltransferase [Ruminococcus flavefaciens]